MRIARYLVTQRDTRRERVAPMVRSIDSLIRTMPKVELHLHIEGTLEPEMAFELAERNRVAIPWKSPEQMRAAYDFSDLQSFLDLYYAASAVLVTRRDFHDLTWAYLERAASEHVRHAEIHFDPQSHLARGVAFDTVVGGITDALREGRDGLGITSRLIMAFLRDLPEAGASETLDLAVPHLQWIHGVGLDSAEVGNPPGMFRHVFARARELGLERVAHAGEEGPPAYIADSLDLLDVSRIDHGVRALEDPRLVRRLAEQRVPLTVCPLSNIRLRVFDTLEDHPLLRMLNAGLSVTVNSDDPAYFGGYITANYLAAHTALGIDRGELYVLAANAIDGCWLPVHEKLALTEELAAAFG
jgi:adenosine deaminase